MDTTRQQRPTIGFFLQEASGAGGFQELVWHSLARAARSRDVNALIFAGGSLDAAPYNPFEKNLNLVYELADRQHVDGLIVNYTIGNYVPVERFLRFCRDFSLPLVTISGALAGFPSVRVDNRKGLRDAIRHLIVEHRANKIAFIKGSAGNPDAEERWAVFEETMTEAGLTIDPGLVYDGLFNEDSGSEAVNHFLKGKGGSLDAIVASNDAMAFGAITRLREMGVHVPWDIAVTGFDDTVEARATVPSLTTVRQPIDEIIGAAVDVLTALIAGKQVEESNVVASRLILRQSCGCSSAMVREAVGRRNEFPADRPGSPALPPDRAALLREAARRATGGGEMPQLPDIIAAFLQDAEGGQPSVLLPKLQRILQEEILRDRDISAWQRVLCVWRDRIREWWQDAEMIARAEDVVFQAAVLGGELSQQALARQAITAEKKAKELQTVGQQLITTFQFDQLKRVLLAQLALLRIPSSFVSLFKDRLRRTNDAEAFIAFRGTGGEWVPRHQTHTLPEKDFFPVDRRYTGAVHPLCFRENALGYALFELGPEDGMVYHSLQVQIGSSLMGSELIRQREMTEAAEKTRSDAIQNLVRPMLDAVAAVTQTAREKIGVIGDLIAVTTENGEKLQSTDAAITVMGGKIAKMTDVVALIDDISSRVNILAINTSIESAHAGSFGKGFAVIAGEIRRLADSIKANATVIAEFLADIRPLIDGSRKASASSREAFQRLEQDVADVSQALQQITRSMNSLSEGSAKILSLMNVS